MEEATTTSNPASDDDTSSELITVSLKPHIKSRIKYIFLQYGFRISVFIAILGCIWIFLFPVVTITTGEAKCRGTYFSENALLVHSTKPTIDYVALDTEYHSLHDEIAATSANVYYQTYLDYSGVNRTNVYGILPGAPGSQRKESIVLVSYAASNASVSAGLSLLSHLANNAPWLAKDIILLVTSDIPEDARNGFAPGVKAFVTSYHASPFNTDLFESQDRLSMHAGVIRAAFVLDFETGVSDLSAVAILSSGLNGQLPNLDLVNTAVLAFRRERVPTSMDILGDDDSTLSFVKNSLVSQGFSSAVNTYLDDLFQLFRFMKNLATGPNGAHAEFINYNIDSITLYATEARDGSKYWVSSLHVLRGIEVLVHTMSNLEEKFHQSFYFYLLPNNTNLISIGEYYIPLVLITLPAIAMMFVLLIKTAGLQTALATAISAVTIVLSSTILVIAVQSLQSHIEGGEELEVLKWLIYASLVEINVVFIVIPYLKSKSIFCGNNDVEFQKKHARSLAIEENEAALKKGILLEDTVAREARLLKQDLLAEQDGWKAIKIAANGLTIYAACGMGILNYSLALLFALFTVPLTFVTPTSKVIPTTILLTTSSPIVLAVLLELIIGGVLKAIHYQATSFYFLNTFAFPLFCCVYVPIHTLNVGIWTGGGGMNND